MRPQKRMSLRLTLRVDSTRKGNLSESESGCRRLTPASALTFKLRYFNLQRVTYSVKLW
jgi:hypothetical protein